MASQTQGIQQLLAAEKKAAEKVSDARKRKAKRLKQAKEEAQLDIEKYRQEQEKKFREKEVKHMGSRDDVATRIDAETNREIENMKKQVANNKEEVIFRLLDLVSHIEPKLHRNYRPTS